MDDLRKDESFKAEDYPAISEDYSLKVIQIAESVNGELFIYVYQPSAGSRDLMATSINISTAINDSLHYENYKLEYKNSSGVFYKYKVSEFKVKQDVLRYYDIAAIFRTWNKDIDTGTGNDNEINEVSFEVGQLWTVVTVGGEVSYNMTKRETVLVTSKYVDFLFYPDGYDFWGNSYGSCRSHYVGFNCEYQIDELYSADVLFTYQSSYSKDGGAEVLGEPEPKTVQLKYDDIAENTGDKIGGEKYIWNRIEKVSDFIKQEELTNETKNELKGKQWILRFYETEYKMQYTGNPANGTFHWEIYSSVVSEVTILRLHFKSKGKVYNLGVVDNKQSGDDKPGNEYKARTFIQWLWESIVHTFTGKGKWYEIAVTVVTIVIAIAVICIIVRLLKFIIGSFRKR